MSLTRANFKNILVINTLNLSTTFGYYYSNIKLTLILNLLLYINNYRPNTKPES